MKYLLPLLLLVSCNDFTERNEIPQRNQEVISEKSLLQNTGDINKGEFTPEKLIANAGIFVLTPTAEKLSSDVKTLSQSHKQYCASLELFENEGFSQETNERLLEPVKDAWKVSMASYHQLLAMNVGPFALSETGPLFAIYSFDQSDKCRLDSATSTYSTRPTRVPRFDVIDNYNVRGLDSIERYLFASLEQSVCRRTNSRIDRFFAKPLLEKAKIACGFASHLFTDIVANAETVANEWSTDAGFYTQTMLSGSVGNPIDVVNKISQSLFSLDTETKDKKIAFPAGFEVKIGDIVRKCSPDKCAGSREHQYSEFSLMAIYHSILGFKNLFYGINPETGNDGIGLDDLLESRGHKDIADDIAKNTDELLARLNELSKNTTLGVLLSNLDTQKCEDTRSDNRLEEACALVWDIRKVTDVLKNEYLAALVEFNAPKRAQGDND